VVSTGFHEFHSAFAEVLQKRLDLFRQCVNLSDLCHAKSADADASPPHAIALPSRRCTTQCEQSACLRRCDPCQRLTELIVLRQRWHKNASANEAAATAQGYNIQSLVSRAHRQAPSQSTSARGTRWATNLPSMLLCAHSCRRILTLLMGLRVLCATASTCISQSQLSHPSDS
jgi:hypothetical protein